MIPVRLAMRNFMCYRDNVPPINFDGIHLACLSGDNGNGKSALIDAMTWALWGQTRARSDDELVHANQTETEVEFDFRVGQQLYRIIRKHSRPKKQGRTGQSLLEFQIATADGFRSISGEGVIQTQKKISDVLHMDYDTFINSAYLRQGHADEFTQQPPSKRKEVLAGILDFSLYDGLEERAKDLAKEQEAEKFRLDSGIGEIDNELAREPAYQAELVLANADLASSEALFKEKEAALDNLRRERQLLEQKKSQLDQIQAHISTEAKQLELWREQANRHRQRIEECEELMGQRPAIEEGFTRLAAAKKLSEELDVKFRQISGIQQRQHRLEMAIEQAKQSILTEHAVVRNKIGELDARVQAMPARKEHLRQAELAWQQLAAPADALQKQKLAGQELQEKLGALVSEAGQLEKQISEIKENLTLLSRGNEARCPLCDCELGVDGLKLIQAKYTSQLQAKTDSLKSSQAEIARQRAEIQSLKAEVSQTETQLERHKTDVQGKISVLKKEIAESEDAAKALSQEKGKLAELEEQIAARSYAINEQSALSQLEAELAQLSYSPEQHDQVRQQLTGLRQYEQLKLKLDEADCQVGKEREAEAKAQEAALKLQQSLEAGRQQIQTLSADMSRLPTVQHELALAENQFKEISARRNQAQETVGSVKAKLARCAELAETRKEKTRQLDQAAKQADIYQELAEAFGKRGIQALLIEMALPEIENEANELLGRMTDNRMHVKFETQRETKKRTVQETLDITISDELGTRNYEMFSGGETFRINFAIRIALSKLLARRAGAPLPTLIIDEGFGTQDINGIEKLKEAINSIQDDFEKIIVITHIEELRDAFPTRIDVVKTPEGSTLSVS